MDRKIIIISVIIIALVSAGAAAAISLNYEPDMKTASFDGIKMKVPVNAKFTKTAAGFEDPNYGISVQTFKNSEDVVNFLKSVSDAQVISVANLPANAIAYKNGDMTYILVTSGQNALCVGALDQNLDVKMANSITFPNGKNTKVNHGVLGVGKKLPNADVDFNFILNITKNVNNDIFNQNIILESIDNSTNLTNEYDALDSTDGIGMAGQPESDIDYATNGDNAISSEVNDNSGNSLIDNYNSVVEESGADEASSGSSDEGSNFISDDGSGDASSSADEVSSSSEGSSSGSSDDSQEELSKDDCKKLVEDMLPDGYKISKTKFENGLYIFTIKSNAGDNVGKITVDPKTQEIDDTDLEI